MPVYKIKGSIQSSLVDTIREFSNEHPKLYEKHYDYFYTLIRMIRYIKPPISICWRNKMSKKTYICTIVSDDTIIIDKYTPQEIVSLSKKIIVVEKPEDLRILESY